MNNIVLQALTQYDIYANRILFDIAAKLGIEELDAIASPSRASALTLLYHVFVVEGHFLAQCQGQIFEFDRQSIAEIGQLKDLVEHHGGDLQRFVDSLDDDFEREINVEIGDRVFHFPVWQVLTQVFLHSAQHRGELSILLSQHDHPLPIDDIIIQFAGQSGQPWHGK